MNRLPPKHLSLRGQVCLRGKATNPAPQGGDRASSPEKEKPMDRILAGSSEMVHSETIRILESGRGDLIQPIDIELSGSGIGPKTSAWSTSG